MIQIDDRHCITEEKAKAIEAEQLTRLITARMSLIMSRQHSIGPLAYRMKLTPAWWHPTMATDGQHLYFNPLFVSTLTIGQLKTAIAHETYHNALGHPWRKGDRIHSIANVAMDYAINGELDRFGFEHIPNWCLDAKYTGKAFEVIYQELFEQYEKQASKGGNGQPQDGGDAAATTREPGKGIMRGNPANRPERRNPITSASSTAAAGKS